MSFGIAKYKCNGCSHEFEHPPKPTQCPKCGHEYVDWVNFKDWQRAYENHQKNRAFVDLKGIYGQKTGNSILKNMPNF